MLDFRFFQHAPSVFEDGRSGRGERRVCVIIFAVAQPLPLLLLVPWRSFLSLSVLMTLTVP